MFREVHNWVFLIVLVYFFARDVVYTFRAFATSVCDGSALVHYT